MTTTLEILNAAQLAVLANKPVAMMTQTSSQSITTNSNTKVSWTTALNDNWTGWSSGSATRYTVQVAGVYRLTAAVCWNSSSSGERHCEFYQNGTENLNSLGLWKNSPGAFIFDQFSLPTIVSASAGDYFEVNVYQTSGSALTISPGTNENSSWTVEFLHF